MPVVKYFSLKTSFRCILSKPRLPKLGLIYEDTFLGEEGGEDSYTVHCRMSSCNHPLFMSRPAPPQAVVTSKICLDIAKTSVGGKATPC